MLNREGRPPRYPTRQRGVSDQSTTWVYTAIVGVQNDVL